MDKNAWREGRIREEDLPEGGPASAGQNTPIGKVLMVLGIIVVFGLMTWWLVSWVARFFGGYFGKFDEMGPG